MSREEGAGSVGHRSVWPSYAMIAGGSLMIALWPVYTRLHGPTSVDEGGRMLGRGPEFWGSMMEGPPLLLIALGLAGSYRRLMPPSGRMTRFGFWLAMVALVVPALANLAILAVVPPILAPVLGVGLILVAAGDRASSLPGLSRTMLLAMAILQFFAFLWTALVRPDVMDQIYGYRIYGTAANVLFGLGWILLGVSLLAGERAPIAEPAVSASSS